jgi:arylsulfatase A-like enzyme
MLQMLTRLSRTLVFEQHPPVIATSEWMVRGCPIVLFVAAKPTTGLTLLPEPYDVQDYYYDNRDQLFIPPSIKDSMQDSAYAFENQRKFKKQSGPYPFDDDDKIAELTAIYYGLIEEVDSYVGEIVRRIDDAGLRRDTMIVLTSDHGDMLGTVLRSRQWPQTFKRSRHSPVFGINSRGSRDDG